MVQLITTLALRVRAAYHVLSVHLPELSGHGVPPVRLHLVRGETRAQPLVVKVAYNDSRRVRLRGKSIVPLYGGTALLGARRDR